MEEPARIRVADPAPPYCSACFGAKPTMRHVDFGAAWDGPMLAPLKGAVGVIGHSVDDLIICEECLARAAGLVGLTDASRLQRRIDQLEAANEQLHEQLRASRRDKRTLDELRSATERAAAVLRPPARTPADATPPKRKVQRSAA